MTFRLVNAGEEFVLDTIFAVGFTLGLFRNDVDSGLTDVQKEARVIGDLTVANFTGYAAIALTGGSWTTTQGDPSTATYAQQNFTCLGVSSNTIYGYMITRTSGGALVGYEYLNEPSHLPDTVTSIGDIIRVTPSFTLKDTVD